MPIPEKPSSIEAVIMAAASDLSQAREKVISAQTRLRSIGHVDAEELDKIRKKLRTMHKRIDSKNTIE